MNPAVSLSRRVLVTLALAVLVNACAREESVSAAMQGGIEVGAVRVSVAFSRFAGRRLVHAGTQADHFHVILENVSAKPLKLWRGREYSGYASLWFRLTTREGADIVVKRTPLPAGSETDMSFVLEPGEHFVIDVHPRSAEWSGFPTPGEGLQAFSLQASYTSDMPKADPLGWTGQVVSPVYDIEWLP